jgi:hypothetical protein
MLFPHTHARLQLHGSKGLAAPWARLAATAPAAASSLQLDRDVGAAGWAPGDSLALASTDYDPYQTERLTVTGVTGSRLSVTPPLRFMHFGQVTEGVDERGEVRTCRLHCLLCRGYRLCRGAAACKGSSKQSRGEGCGRTVLIGRLLAAAHRLAASSPPPCRARCCVLLAAVSRAARTAVHAQVCAPAPPTPTPTTTSNSIPTPLPVRWRCCPARSVWWALTTHRASAATP